MTDRYDHDLLLAYLEDDLEPGDRAQVDRMLEGDAQLASLMRGLAADRAALRALPSEPAPGDLSFDLVQGLERRMLLDAPEVDVPGASGPIPISRGRAGTATARTGGPRWGRAVGIGGMAAALALAAGLVIYFNQADPLSRTAFDMAEQQPADGTNNASANAPESGHPGNAFADLSADVTPSPIEARRGGAETDEAGLNLAARAREAILNSGRPPQPGAGAGRSATPGAMPGPAAVAGNPPGDPPAALAGGRAGGTEPAIALTAYAPQRALHIASDNPELSRQQVVAWCVDNGIPVVEPLATPGPNAPALGGAPREQLALLIEEDQLGELIEVVNRIEHAPFLNQRAELGAVDTAIYGDANLVEQEAQEEAADAAAQLADAVDNALDSIEETEGNGAAAGENADPPANAQQVVSVKVPEDLGDAYLNRQNIANTFQYTNQDELAQQAQRDAEVLRNQRPATPNAAPPNALAQTHGDAGAGDAGAPGGALGGAAGDEADTQQRHAQPADPAQAGEHPSRGQSRAGSGSPSRGGAGDREADNTPDPNAAPGQRPNQLTPEDDTAGNQGPPPMRDPGAQPANDADPHQAPGRAATDEHTDTDDADDTAPRERLRAMSQADDGTRSDADAAPPVRGNWLMPQMPLAESTPVWNDPPSAKLVPIVFVFQRPAPGTETAPPAGQQGPVTPDAGTLRIEPDTADPAADAAEPVPPATPDDPPQDAPAEDGND